VHDAILLGDAAAAGPIKANRMHLVEIGEGVIFDGEIADRRDRGDVAVHRIDALEDDELRRSCRIFRQQLFEMLHIVVTEDVLHAAAMANALDHRGMVLLVGEDHKAWDQTLQRRKRGFVGDVGRGEEKRRFLAVQIRELGFELDMIMRGAGNVARAAGTGAYRVNGFMHGGPHGGVLAHAEIIVGAPDRHPLRSARGEMLGIRISAATALQVCEYPVAALTVQRLQVVLEVSFISHLSQPKPCSATHLF
jgi:hypothetical protein